MHQKPDVQEVSQPIVAEIRGRIEFSEIHFGYPSQPELISGFTLDIPAGKKIALVGTSGNDKSTILKLAARFYDPLSGEIKLDGVPLKQMALEQIHEVLPETLAFEHNSR